MTPDTRKKNNSSLKDALDDLKTVNLNEIGKTQNFKDAYEKLHDHLSTENIPFELSEYGNDMVKNKKNLDRKNFTPPEVNKLKPSTTMLLMS
jgi:hypothetical protein